MVDSQSHGREAAKDIAFGSAAGVVGKFIEYPFDTVKVRLQSQPDGVPLRYAGPVDCFRQSFRQDGFLGLYRGISAPLLGAAVETSCLFFSVTPLVLSAWVLIDNPQYRIAQEVLQSTMYPASSPLPFPVLVVCGAASGAFTSLALTPIELIKCQMQVPLKASQTVPSPGPLTLIATVYRHHGFRGFWHGQLGTLIRETGGSAAWFGTYEGASLLLRRMRASGDAAPQPLPLHQQMLAGAAAGVSYNFVFFPADTIKSRMQTEEVGPASAGRKSFGTVGRALWRQQGLRGLYQGCGITVLRAAPSSAFIFAIYEGLRSYAA
ncbi:MAG: hypothetical protein M1832_002028 [Thelocarpon impressellum]|nr:MAG: hypothetical protein M1832_002028 [Thelocarpon impressellum]